MPYLYETHLHTHFGSRCGVASGHDYIRRYQDAGYAGIFVTDHFFHGNCAVDQTLPWREQVNWYCAGFEDAWEEGQKLNFQVLFGWEENFQHDEYLVYGLGKEWLMEHPEVKNWTRQQQFEETHRWGGCVIQAHPFRDRDYVDRIHLNTAWVDGVEVFNAANPIYVNSLGMRYAENLGKIMTAGSDIHRLETGEESGWKLPNISGIYFDTPLKNEQDFARRICSGIQPGLIAPIDKMKQQKNPELLLRPDLIETVEVIGKNVTMPGYDWKKLTQ